MTLWPFLTLFSVTWFVSIRNVLTQLFFSDLVFVQFLVAVKGNKSFETVYKKPSVVSPPGWDVELLFSFFRLPVRAVWFLSPSLISPSDDKQYGCSIPLMLPHSCCFIVLRVAFGNCFCHLAPPSGQTWHFYSTPSEGVALTKSSWIFLSLSFLFLEGKNPRTLQDDLSRQRRRGRRLQYHHQPRYELLTCCCCLRPHRHSVHTHIKTVVID